MPFDIRDSYTLTETVTREVQTVLESENWVGPTIAPVVNVRDRKLKRRLIEVGAAGIANFKAPHATPTIFVPQIRYDQEYIELVDMDEMSPITEDEWEKLTGDNEFEKMRVGADITQRLRALQYRYEVRTEWMRWEAFHGQITAEMADDPDQTVVVKYGVPTANNVAVSPLWTARATSTPTAQLRAGQKYLQQITGHWGSRIYMGPDTYEHWQYSAEVADLLKPNSPGDYFIPTTSQLEGLLYGGTNGPDRPRPGMPAPEVIVTSAGWRTEGSYDRGTADMNYFLAEGEVLITPTSPIEGENIADVPNGRVLMRPTPTAEPNWRQGPSSETLISANPPYTQYTRQACVRLPRINVPRAFYWLSVGSGPATS